MGGTGNIRTNRGTSSCNGYKTLGSILASDSGSGAGSVRRLYGYWANKNKGNPIPLQSIFNINYGQFRSRSEWFIY